MIWVRLRHVKILVYFACILTCLSLTGECRGEQVDYSKTPVYFVHGHGYGPKLWEPMVSYLAKNGYPRHYLEAIQLEPKDGANIPAAEKQIKAGIQSFLEMINARNKAERRGLAQKSKVDLVSHSMGALSSRWYAARVCPERVRVWVSLGGANHGTNSLCGLSDQGSTDLCPAFAKSAEESLVQFSLNGEAGKSDVDETPYGIGEDSAGVKSILPDHSRKILYISIRTSPDKWIQPEESAILDGAGGVGLRLPPNLRVKETSPGNFLMTNRVGHDEMLSDPETMNLVKAILQTIDAN